MKLDSMSRVGSWGCRRSAKPHFERTWCSIHPWDLNFYKGGMSHDVRSKRQTE